MTIPTIVFQKQITDAQIAIEAVAENPAINEFLSRSIVKALEKMIVDLNVYEALVRQIEESIRNV